MPITSQVNAEKQLTIVTATGELSFDEVRDAITSFYEGDHTLKVLWDIREASARGLSSRQVEQIALLLEEYGGRSSTDAYGIGEPANIATAAAVANAVFNAIGVRIYEIPITPASILKALNKFYQ